MGTRADFYIGRGAQAEWLGSIAWDGYPDGITPKGDAWPSVADWDKWEKQATRHEKKRREAK